ncbi:MAG: efflux RND transporter periplasmic adaptor subunit [bacterium]
MIKIAVHLLIVMTFISALSCGQENDRQQASQAPVVVKVAEAELVPLSGQQTYVGSIEPLERVRLSTKIMGWVEQIYFEEGESVAKGALLVKLRSQDLEAKSSQARAAIAAAETHFKNAQTNLKRLQHLFVQKAATQKELDDMRAAFASAEAQKITALEMKKEVDELLKYTALTAPFAGVVARKMMQAGDLANPGQPIMEIENVTQVKVVAKVPESDVQKLRVGMPVKVTVQASGSSTNGASHANVIDKIVPAADRMSRQFDIHILMDNADGRMKSGMFARIAVGATSGETILIPQTAVFRRGQLQGVHVVGSDNKVRLRWIRTGVKTGYHIEVLSGLNTGEKVVIENRQPLLDGQLVEVSQ